MVPRAGLEATLSDSKKKYGDKVNALLSAWEHVTNYIPAASPEDTHGLIEWVHKHTLELVLRGEWPKLSPATKTHLSVTLQRCASHLAHHPAATICTSLIKIVQKPWKHAVLDKIINQKATDNNDDDRDVVAEEEFCCSEKGELLAMRLKILCEERCEDIAVNLAAACVRTLRRSDRLQSLSEPEHVHYMIDLYIILLFKLKRTKDIFAQLKLMNLNDGLGLLQRLAGERKVDKTYRQARIWRLSFKVAELVAPYLATTGMVKPLHETGSNVLEEIFYLWAKLYKKNTSFEKTLPDIIRKLIEPAESAPHIYLFCGVLLKIFGDDLKPLVIESYIRALTTDVNELESQKARANKENTREIAKRLSNQFLNLSEIVKDNISIARECILTAYSIHPTRACYNKIRQIAVASGKIKDDSLVDGNGNTEENDSENRDHLLKSLLTSPMKNDEPTTCPHQPDSKSGELCLACCEFDVDKSEKSVIKDTPIQNYDEKVVNQVLDGAKLGLSPQLCDDLSVVLYSQRYHMLNWGLEWKEFSALCENYLEHAEEIRNTNKELKFLNIDYSMFKDMPTDEERDNFFGIEKGYEQWMDDSSEPFAPFQPEKRPLPESRRRIEESSDSDSGSLLQVRRTARQRKLHRLESSESDYDSNERKPKHFRVSSVSDSEDTNTQDSQTDSLGSDGCRQNDKTNKLCNKDNADVLPKGKRYCVLVNENLRKTEEASGSDASNDIITLFAADMDENNRETIKASSYPATAQLRILTEKRTDPAVLKSLRMFRPQNTKVIKKNILSDKNKDNVPNGNNNIINKNNSNVAKFAPMLSTLNLNPKIVLTRADDLLQAKKPALSAGDLKSELMNISNTMTFSAHKNSYHKNRKSEITCDKNGKSRKSRKNRKSFLRKAAINRLAKNIPGLNSLDMMVPPRVQPTVNVVQLSRNIPQSPNSGSINSGNTPPRNRTSSIAGNIQLPGTPSSGGHDSGVGMSPAGQTPPPRSSALHDVGEEANQPPDTSSPGSTNASVEADSPRNQRNNQNDSPNKSPSPNAAINSEQIQLVYKQDGMYQLASVNPNAISNQRSVLTLQNIEEGTRNIQRLPDSARNAFERSPQKSSAQQQSGLPKFQHAFGKTIYTLSTDTSTVATTSTTDTVSLQKTPPNLSKAVQTSVASSQASINVQSITNIPNLQLSSGRQILNIVQTSAANSTVTNPSTGQTITQIVQNASPGVIYAQKIPSNVTISTTNPGQLSLIPTIAHTNSLAGGRAGVVKLNIIRAPIRQQNIAIQAAIAGSRIQGTPRPQQQPQQQQPQPQQTTVRTDSLLNEVTSNPVSSTTLEQLREFESVLEQVKERSTIQPQNTQTTASSTAQTQTTTQTQAKQQQDQQAAVSAIAQQLLISTQSSPNSEFSGNANGVQFQEQVFPKVSTPAQKVTNTTPVVVFTSYCQPAASPALSVTSQSSSSPCVTPAPASVPSAGKTPPTPSPKSAKKAVPKTIKTSATNTSKASPIPKPQQKPQEDEQTAQRIYTILAEYAEQLRNSPDLNNKPAPRRRSNPPTNPSQSSKRKKSGSSKSKTSGQQSSEMSPSAEDLGRTMGSEDSSSGVAQVQDSPAGFTSQDEAATPVASVESTPEPTRNVTQDSNDSVEVNVKRRNLFFTESGTGQPRAVIVQETVPTASVSVSEALASVTGKVAGTAVLVSGTNYVLPMNLVKGTQQFHIVSGSSKLLAVPGTVRTTGTTGVSNTLVLQSFLNQASKIISQPGQVKQVKMPTLQTLTTGQTLAQNQNAVVIPQQNTFSSESSEVVVKQEAPENIKSEPTTPVSESTILVNKSPTIGLIQRNLSDITEGQQICGVITSNPNLTLQGTRLFNSSIAKLSTNLKTESVVCLAPTTPQSPEKKMDADKPMQMGTIALFATQSEVPVINNNQNQLQKETKETATEIVTSPDKVISPKSVKRKIDEVENAEKPPPVSSAIFTTLQNAIKAAQSVPITTIATKTDRSDSSIDFSGRTENSSEEQTIKVENGVLCGNARLQEAWEPERKSSPDTPWRYVPTSTNQLNIEPMKVYSRDGENSENVQNVLQIINKGQSVEMASGQVFQTNTKKYFMNHTLEPFQQYANKGAVVKTNPVRSEREMQRIDRTRAAIERELRLQKSLSEECEDLGVDEPSTSDLFPEADLLFDNNHSPSFDHSSQDASCSQSLGVKFNASYFRPLDTSSLSRDASPVDVNKSNERRKTPAMRSRGAKETMKRTRRDSKTEDDRSSPSKQMRLSLDGLSQDDASNSMDGLENDVLKDNKIISRNGSKEGSPSTVSSIPSNMKLDMDMDSESLPNAVNNASTASSGDESLTLLSTNTADVTIPSPLSSIAGPLLSTHKYTYSNKKRAKSNKVMTAEYLSWESPISERTRSSSEDEDSESMSSQNDEVITNGLEDNMQIKTEHCTYLKKDKLVNARVVLNRADAKAILAKRAKVDVMSDNPVDKSSEASDDETCHATLIEPDCRARRSSLRGHVKKGCACCNGSPERPKKKVVSKVEGKIKKKLIGKQIGKKR